MNAYLRLPATWCSMPGRQRAKRCRLRSSENRLSLESLELRRLMARDINLDDPTDPPLDLDQINCSAASRSCSTT